jgi:hypothetical protein
MKNIKKNRKKDSRDLLKWTSKKMSIFVLCALEFR